MNLVIDIGNTLAKIAVFKNKKLQSVVKTESASFKKKLGRELGRPEIKSVILSSVIRTKPDLIRLIKTKPLFFIRLSHLTPMPIKIKYNTPHTLGNDRIANAVAACNLFPGKNILVIDTGTCLKFDFVDAKKNYLGGSISPGLNMRYKALHFYTQKLPLLSPSKKIVLTGRTTKESILSGVQNGMTQEINGVINQYKKKYKNLIVVLTGGESGFFANHLKNSIFAAPNFTLTGLNEILNYNALHYA
ncbi:MAG: type III pantothenate kinase [Bacteroidia bacterium]